MKLKKPEISPYFDEENNELLKSIENYAASLIKIFKVVLKKIVQEWELAKKITTLLDQLNHNAKGIGKYLHAAAATIRTIMEFFIFFNLASMDEEEIKELELDFKKSENLSHTIQVILNFHNNDYNGRELLNNFKHKALKNLHNSVKRKREAIFCKLAIKPIIGEKFWKFWTKRKILDKIIHRLIFDEKEVNNYLKNFLATLKEFLENLDKEKLSNFFMKFEIILKQTKKSHSSK